MLKSSILGDSTIKRTAFTRWESSFMVLRAPTTAPMFFLYLGYDNHIKVRQ